MMHLVNQILYGQPHVIHLCRSITSDFGQLTYQAYSWTINKWTPLLATQLLTHILIIHGWTPCLPLSVYVSMDVSPFMMPIYGLYMNKHLSCSHASKYLWMPHLLCHSTHEPSKDGHLACPPLSKYSILIDATITVSIHKSSTVLPSPLFLSIHEYHSHCVHPWTFHGRALCLAPLSDCDIHGYLKRGRKLKASIHGWCMNKPSKSISNSISDTLTLILWIICMAKQPSSFTDWFDAELIIFWWKESMLA